MSSPETDRVAADRKPWSTGRWVAALVILFCGLHGLLFSYDLATPGAWTHGDRAGDRVYAQRLVFEKIVLQGKGIEPLPTDGSLADRLYTAGPPGDYLIPAALSHYGGHYLAIIVQVIITILSLVAVFFIAREMGLSRRGSFCSAALFGLLPGTVVQGHMFVTEAWFVPSTIFTVLTALRILTQGPSVRRVALLVLFSSFAIFFRLQFALTLILILLLLLWFCHDRKPLLWAPLLLLALIPPPLWNASLEGSTHLDPDWDARAGLSIHLRLRLARMSTHDAPELAIYYNEGTAPSPAVFLKTLAKYPVAYAKTILKDNVDYFVNPGTLYVVRYLELVEDMPTGHELRAVRDTGSPWDVASYLWQWNAVFCVVFALHLALWMLITLLVLYGGWNWLLHAISPRSVVVFIAVAVMAHMAVIQIAYQSRWSLRQPIEFYFAIFCVFGLTFLYRKIRDKPKTANVAAMESEAA